MTDSAGNEGGSIVGDGVGSIEGVGVEVLDTVPDGGGVGVIVLGGVGVVMGVCDAANRVVGDVSGRGVDGVAV